MRLRIRTIFGIFLRGGAAALVLVGSLSSGQSPAASKVPDAQDLVSYVKQTIAWYRQVNSEPQLATEPGDLVFLNDSRSLGDQIARLSVEFAKAEAPLVNTGSAAATAPAQDQGGGPSRYQALVVSTAKADHQVQQSRAQLDSLKAKLAGATGAKRRSLEAAVSETESELELAQTRRDALRRMVEFISGATGRSGDAAGLQSQIEELERALPPVAKAESSGSPTAASSVPARVEPSGILALITDLRALARKRAALDEGIRLTDALADGAKVFRTPMVAELKRLAGEGDALTNEPDSDDPGVLAQQKEALDFVTTQFKQLANTLLPLGKQRILLDLYKNNLVNWRHTVQGEYSAELRSLLLRLAVLGMVLAAVVGASELWRRAILRYVHDAKRRHQFMLLRRILLWVVIVTVVAFAFATELGSLATFAGLLTAGIAVALQNVILSIAGYFFLIGSRGVRVGDRVQISGITGEVVDIGLVRLHLMELANSGAAAQPTGRVVVFSNSVVFQPTGGFFKQIPGTNFIWHEIKLTLAADSDYRAVEQRLMGAVETVFAEYRENMEHQRQRMERALTSVAVNTLRPQSRLCLTQSGLDVVIRYPLELEKAAEVDDRITREVLDAIERRPKLRLVGSGTPNIQPVTEPARASKSSD